jgi:hypothetical protein
MKAAKGVLMLFIVYLFSGCVKYVPGPQGDPGAPGKKGNAVYSHSVVFTVASSAWTPVENTWEAAVYSEEITSQVLAYGEVKIYKQNGEQWSVLPCAEGDLYTHFKSEKGMLRLFYLDLHGGSPQRPLTGTYRLVTIAPVQ